MTKIEITNPDKIIYSDCGIKKIDVINYYIDIAPQMLPFVKKRILSVIRCHSGVGEECFFKKHPQDADKVCIFNDDEQEYFYIKDINQLIWQVQNGTIEFHPWGSTINALENPDMMVFDLDPDENLSLKALRDAVLKVKSVLDELGLLSYLKTSGGKGYHIIVPFTKSENWDIFYQFSKQIALICEQNWPNIFTTNIKKVNRKGKIFVDYLRNNRGSTCVAPYSLRARAGAPISMPILWEDLTKIKPNEINIKNYKKYSKNAWGKFIKNTKKIK